MGIYGVGIDLIQTARIEKAIERWGSRLERRVFTQKELKVCSARKNQAACLALRFAAKEAFSKALGVGMRSPVLWLDIEVRSNELGKPEMFLSERALEFCHGLGVHAWHLSLTDQGDYGAAVVILESGP